MSGFKKATRTQRPLRMALYGPSNSGKTFTALMIARELSGSVALIDTERSSASIYALDPESGRGFEFDAQSLTKYAHTDYVAMIEEAAGYDVLIIDSISHAWDAAGGMLDLVESVVEGQSGKKDGFRAWSDPRVRAAEDRLWGAVLGFPGHVIVTMRAKTAYERSVNESGKTVIEKLGLEPRQRKGIEFEFDVIGEMDKEHYLLVDKARDPEGRLEGKRIHKPGVEFAKTLKAWLDAGTTPAEDYGARIKAACEEIARLMDEPYEDIRQKAAKWIEIQYSTTDLSEIPNDELAQIPEKLMDTYGPGTPEEQRQSRMAEREAYEEHRREPRVQLREVIDRHDGLDAEWIWAEICNRSKGDEPTNEEVLYFADHIDKHADLWMKPKGGAGDGTE